MGIWKDLKTWFNCKRTDRMEEYNQYRDILEEKKKDIVRFEQFINNNKKRIEYLREHGYSNTSKEYKEAEMQLQRWKYCLDEIILELQYIRPNSKEDIEYRNNNTGSKFLEELRKVMSPKLNLVFHGTPIYFAREILRSGSISSSADRYNGYIKSTDNLGEISVSDIDSLNRTLDFFSGMASYRQALPAGCVFAMYPKNDNDFNKKQSLMSSVDFNKNPEQLYGIFTTHENIPSVQKWLEEAGLNPNLVYDFEGFINAVKMTSKAIDINNKFEKNIGVSDEVIDKVENLSQNASKFVKTNNNNLELDNSNREEK